MRSTGLWVLNLLEEEVGRLLLVGRVVLLMWDELPCECGASYLGASFMWGDLSWGELSVIRMQLPQEQMFLCANRTRCWTYFRLLLTFCTILS